ncbi:MAG: hypothetical protein OEZ04_11135 [Nitrospinota bacterium]|nr:hypothetical protein [Nitrospinota bacterium]
MVYLLTYYGMINCLALAAALALGYFTDNLFMVHFAAGFLGALSAVLWIGVAMFYLIYSGQAVKRGAEAGLVESKDVAFCYEAKKRLFPWFVAAILLLVTTPFLGATAHMKTGSAAGHHLAAWMSALVFWVSVYLAHGRITEHGRMVDEIVKKVEQLRRAKAASQAPAKPGSNGGQEQ